MTSNPHKNYHHLLVDWDGTVQQTLQTWLDATLVELKKRDIDLEPKFVAEHFLSHFQLSEKYGVTDPEVFAQTIIAACTPHIPQTPLNHELWKTLLELKTRGVSQAIVSTSRRAMIERAIAHHAMAETEHFFEHLITPDIPELLGKRKPDPAPILHALHLLQGELETAIIIGDSTTDILAGQNAGIDTIWWYPPENEVFYNYDEMMAYKPTYVARTVEEVKQILKCKRNLP